MQQFDYYCALSAGDYKSIFGLLPVGGLSYLKSLRSKSLKHSSVLCKGSLERKYCNIHIIRDLFASLGHKYLYLALVDPYHSLSKVFAQLCDEFCIFIVCYSLNDCAGAFGRIAGFEDS